MATATITSKGQITLPKEVRDKLHLTAGEKVDFRVNEESRTAVLVPLNKSIDDVFGALKSRRKVIPVTVEEMNTAIRKKFSGAF